MSLQAGEHTTLLATFCLGEALFALDAGVIQEVIRLGPVTPIRHSPAEVAGVINLRGRIVTLLDTGLILGLSAAVRDRESRIFIIEDRGEYLGLLVDRVGEVIEAEGHSPLPLNVPDSRARFFVGVCRAGDRVIARLETQALLDAALTGVASAT